MFPFNLSHRVMHSGMEPRTNTLRGLPWANGGQLGKEADSAPAGGGDGILSYADWYSEIHTQHSMFKSLGMPERVLIYDYLTTIIWPGFTGFKEVTF